MWVTHSLRQLQPAPTRVVAWAHTPWLHVGLFLPFLPPPSPLPQILLAVTDRFGSSKPVFQAMVGMYSSGPGLLGDAADARHSNGGGDPPAAHSTATKVASVGASGAPPPLTDVGTGAGTGGGAGAGTGAPAPTAAGVVVTEEAAKSTLHELLWEDICQKWEALASGRRVMATHQQLARRKQELPVLGPLMITSPANSPSHVTAVGPGCP